MAYTGQTGPAGHLPACHLVDGGLQSGPQLELGCDLAGCLELAGGPAYGIATVGTDLEKLWQAGHGFLHGGGYHVPLPTCLYGIPNWIRSWHGNGLATGILAPMLHTSQESGGVAGGETEKASIAGHDMANTEKQNAAIVYV